jgi:hypothetical protein
METYDEDRREILNLVGLDYEDKKTNSHDEIHETKLSTEDLTRNYFKTLPKDIFKKLKIIYKYDFELFGYDPQVYL